MMGKKHACANCRRPIHYVEHVGWLHGELPQYAHEDNTCTRAVCVDGCEAPDG